MSEIRFEASDAVTDGNGVRHATVRSPSLGRRADLSTVTPRSSPVAMVILLHGVYGSHWSWIHRGQAARTLHELVDGSLVPPMLLVTPSDGMWGDGSGYLPVDGADHERWIVEDVLAVVREMHELDRAMPTFLAGFSMGGFGALRLGARHPDVFRATAAHSSVTTAAGLARFGLTPSPADGHDAIDAFRETAVRRPLAIDCGLDDFLLEDNRRLHEQLSAAGVDHSYEELPGGHDWPYWTSRLGATLRRFGAIAGASA